jgi:hypothetical protein
VLRQAWVDSRFDAVSEGRRRELFEMYRGMLAEEEEVTQQHSMAKVRLVLRPSGHASLRSMLVGQASRPSWSGV